MAADTDKLIAPEIGGLSEADVASRVAEGRVNADAGPKTRSVAQIVAEHSFTLFNGVNVLLASLVALTGSWRNLTFIVVVLANLGIGIVQEVRSKRTIDRLQILAERPVAVRRGGADVEVGHGEVVADDILVLGRGDQIPADAEVVWGSAGVNESLLTGESNAIAKRPGDELMSGSFLDSGTLLARVTRVGAESYAARINAEAKYVKKTTSEIMATLTMIIRYATMLLAPVGILLFLRTLSDGSSLEETILTTVAALVGMIPQGLVLLTSTVLVISTARLARQKVLIQQFYCIEMLARVDVLCLDKTGTITSGAMEFMRSVAAPGSSEAEVEAAAACVVRANAHDANETAEALMRHADEAGIAEEPIGRAVPFSSARKYSGCVTAGGRALVLGAAQFVLGDAAEEALALARTLDRRARTLVVAEAGGFDEEGAVTGGVRLLGVVALADQIRDNAADTIGYFVEQGVTLNVISGDDPRTVSNIAQGVGVPGAADYVDATTLTTPEALQLAAGRYHVFGRVTPQQKRELVQALQKEGHTVAMTGDGVNDVLALREADCSVAMASGSDAARNVADVVLVDNDFAHMPSVVAEGRRSINNLQRSASLFLVKTVFSAVLAIWCAIMPPYPFEPVQISLISTSIIGIPSFVLALEPNRERVRGNFLANVLARSLPASVSIILAVAAASGCLHLFGLSEEEVSTVCVLLVCMVGVNLIWRISMPLNVLRSALLVVVVGIIVFGFTIAGPFFELCHMRDVMWVSTAAIGVPALLLFNLSFVRFVTAATTDGPILRALERIERRGGR